MKLRIYFITLLILFSTSSYAFKFSPMSASLGVKGDNNNSLFYIENDSGQPIAIQASLAKREMSVDGVENNSKIGNELSLYPTQLIIPAGEKRSIKVFWTGSEIPKKELAYRLIVEQLPIELEKNKSKKASIKVLLRYVAALYVESESFFSDIRVTDIKEQGKKIQIIVTNSGKKHQVLANLSLIFTDDKSNKKVLFRADELKGMAGENILADSKRVFSFSREGKFALMNPTDKVTISFDKD